MRLLQRIPSKLRPSPRAIVRGAFLLFFVFLCWRLWAFYLWQVTGLGGPVARPEAVAGLIPLGAFMSFFLWVKTGLFDPVMPAGVVIIIAALGVSLLFKRGFCGWICPVGSVWELFGWVGRKAIGRNVRAPRKVDIALRVPKYLMTAVLVYWLASLPSQVAADFQRIPYYAVSDLKILSLAMRPTVVYVLVGSVIALSSVILGNVWCRYLCPLGALYGGLSAASPCTVVRDEEKCIGCSKCTKVCHAGLPVEDARSVRSAECDGCQDCVIVCPAEGALRPKLFGTLAFPWWVWPLLVVGTWALAYFVARVTGHWSTSVPVEMFGTYIRAVGI